MTKYKSLFLLFIVILVILGFSSLRFYKPIKTTAELHKGPSITNKNIDYIDINKENYYIIKRKKLMKKEILSKKSKEEPLVAYTGPIEHIFFHPLIAYPNLAFDGDSHSQGYKDWFVTVKEFDRILDSLFKNNYILINIDALYTEKFVNEKKIMVQKKLMLPKDKKPLILSIDDMNYYDYMRRNGNVYQLILDTNNNIATYSKNPDGTDHIAYDNEIIPILESFIKEHQDFSYNGARGFIGLTGFQGVLGYRTNKLNAPNYTTEKEEALKVINRLKELGWKFASHSYDHLDANKVSYDRLVKDTNQWKKQVESLIGETNIYIYPFGSRIKNNQKKLNFLIDSGFNIFLSVGPLPYLSIKPDYLLMDRRHIDGIAFTYQQKRLMNLFNIKDVIDPIRNEK